MRLSLATCGRWAGRFRRRWFPLLLLLAALATVYPFGGEWGSFYQVHPYHDWNSAQSLTFAENLSPRHKFLVFRRLEPGPGGATEYGNAYNRFPVGGYALIKLGTLPIGDSLSSKLYAGRMLMLLMFMGAAVLAYLALRRITSRRRIALAATLLAFSSYYALAYNDMISNEVTMDLFAVMLAFHGITVFGQERRFGQLAAKSCVALLIGWHVYALLLPFIVLGLAGEIVRANSRQRSLYQSLSARVRNIAAAVIRSRYLRLGMITLLLGIGLLSFNIANEYLALGGNGLLLQLPSVKSMLGRTGLAESFGVSYQYSVLDYGRFLTDQFHRIGITALPYGLTAHTDGIHPIYPPGPWSLPYSGIGMGVVGACLLGLLFAGRGRRLPLAALALHGIVWALLLRNNVAFHPFESVFYIGIPLALISLLLLCLRRRGRFMLPVIAAAALAVFVLSSYQMGRTEAQLRDAEFLNQEMLMSDFQKIRSLTQGKRVYMHQGVISSLFLRNYNVANYYLSGRLVRYDATVLPGCDPDCEPGRDFVIGREINPPDIHADIPAVNSLTPSNRLAFLYDAADIATLYRAEQNAIRSGGYGLPVARSGFDVYMDKGKLIYYKEQCAKGDIAPKFTLHFYPRNAADLSAERQGYGFENRDFDFAPREKRIGRACWATTPLPDYPVKRIRTGQYIRTRGERAWLWRVEFRGDILEYHRDYESIRSGGYTEVSAGGDFEVYYSENRLVYIKEQCSAASRSARFYLHVVPQYAADLPDNRQSGFNNLDFGFAEKGVVLEGDCVAIAPLPDYPILHIRTGQFSGDNQLWLVELAGERLKRLAASEAIAVYSGREPAARSEWNVYIGGANRLVYLKESCAAADAAAKFYLHIIPQNVADLPAERRETGFENRDFRFADRGAMLEGRCAATAGLPDYLIARIRTGQHIAGRGELWRAEFPLGR